MSGEQRKLLEALQLPLLWPEILKPLGNPAATALLKLYYNLYRSQQLRHPELLVGVPRPSELSGRKVAKWYAEHPLEFKRTLAANPKLTLDILEELQSRSVSLSELMESLTPIIAFQQRDEKIKDILVDGIMGLDIWKSPDRKHTYFVFGEQHDGEEFTCEETGRSTHRVSFQNVLSKLLRCIPHTSTWDIFLELDPEHTLVGSHTNNLISTMRDILTDCKRVHEGKSCMAGNLPPVRLHWVDIRKSPQLLPRSHGSKGEGLRVLEGVNSFLRELGAELKANIPLVYKEISHATLLSSSQKKTLGEIFDRLNREIWSEDVAVRWKEFEELMKGFQTSTLSAIEKADLVHWALQRPNVLIHATAHWMDVYTIARLCKSYIEQAIVIVGDQHRINLRGYFTKLGFTLEKEFVRHSHPRGGICTNIPVDMCKWITSKQ